MFPRRGSELQESEWFLWKCVTWKYGHAGLCQAQRLYMVENLATWLQAAVVHFLNCDTID